MDDQAVNLRPAPGLLNCGATQSCTSLAGNSACTATVEQTFGKEQSHADRRIDAVPSGQANQHTPTAIFFGRLAHGPSPHRFAEV